MIEKWKERTWYRMKADYQKELQEKGEEGINFHIKPRTAAMSINDLQVYIIKKILLLVVCSQTQVYYIYIYIYLYIYICNIPLIF